MPDITKSKTYARYLLHNPSEIDWRYMLKQYIKHIMDQEGMNYLDEPDRPGWLSDSEWEILTEISKGVKSPYDE